MSLANKPGEKPRFLLTGVFAVIGCDGTGKSTLTRDLLSHLNKSGTAKRRYLGLVSGEAGDQIKALPLIGMWLEGNLHRKVDRALDMEKKLPGTGTALIMYAFSLWRSFLLRRVMSLSRRGVTIIADRYPQAEVPGFHYDGPGLTETRSNGWLLRKLAEREQKIYERMSEQVPELVIRLNIDAQSAFARKPDHDIRELRDKIAVMPSLKFNDARIAEIDATQPYELVYQAAIAAINDVKSKRR